MRPITASIALAITAITSLSGNVVLAEDTWTRVVESQPITATRVATGDAPVNGIQMYYAVYGKGDPVLLIHGGMSWGDYWGAEVNDLAKDHEVIIADSRGHGRSTRDERPYTYDIMTDDYVALLDYLKLDKVALVGWSDGGIIGIDMALRYPERLVGVFAQSPNVTVDGILPDALNKPTAAGYMSMQQGIYSRVSATPDKFDDFLNALVDMFYTQPDWTDTELARIETPITLVIGDHDEVVSRPHVDHIATVIPGAKEVILKDVSHFAAVQDPVHIPARSATSWALIEHRPLVPGSPIAAWRLDSAGRVPSYLLQRPVPVPAPVRPRSSFVSATCSSARRQPIAATLVALIVVPPPSSS